MEELFEELTLVDTLVPRAEVLRVEVDVELAQVGHGDDAAAEVCPGILRSRHGVTVDMWPGRAFTWEVQFGK